MSTFVNENNIILTLKEKNNKREIIDVYKLYNTIFYLCLIKKQFSFLC